MKEIGKLEEDFGCIDTRIKVKKENLNPHDCWRQQHRNDSRKWLLSDGLETNPPERIYSITKSSYTLPHDWEKEVKNIGKRRELLIKECYEKAYAEVMKEREKGPEVAEYCTEYDGNYFIPDFEPISEEEFNANNEELYQKYPLYGSSPMSIWLHKIEHSRVEAPSGKFTRITDPKNPFKRNSTFSTPIAESLYETEW